MFTGYSACRHRDNSEVQVPAARSCVTEVARCTAPLHPSQLYRVRVNDALVVLLSGCVLVDSYARCGSETKEKKRLHIIVLCARLRVVTHVRHDRGFETSTKSLSSLIQRYGIPAARALER